MRKWHSKELDSIKLANYDDVAALEDCEIRDGYYEQFNHLQAISMVSLYCFQCRFISVHLPSEILVSLGSSISLSSSAAPRLTLKQALRDSNDLFIWNFRDLPFVLDKIEDPRQILGFHMRRGDGLWCGLQLRRNSSSCFCCWASSYPFLPILAVCFLNFPK